MADQLDAAMSMGLKVIAAIIAAIGFVIGFILWAFDVIPTLWLWLSPLVALGAVGAMLMFFAPLGLIGWMRDGSH